MKNKILILMCMLVFSLSFISSAFTGAGSGTEGDPFQVDNCLRLQEIQSYLSNYFILMNDIDCSDTVNWNTGAGFIPVGDVGMYFGSGGNGGFDGQSYTISDLFINRTSTSYVGLFGTSMTNISNVNLVNAIIIGGQYSGILVGYQFSQGIISNSSSTGIVTCASYCGGLIGTSYGTTENSYSRANSTSIGKTSAGLVGRNYGNITNSYSTGFVSGGSFLGGLVDSGSSGTYTNCFWDTETSGQATSGGTAVGKTTAEMKTLSTFSNAGWTISSSSNDLNNGYPYLVGNEWFIYVYEDYTTQISILGVITSNEEKSILTGQIIQEEEIERVGFWQMFSNFFQNIWGWIRGLFN